MWLLQSTNEVFHDKHASMSACWQTPFIWKFPTSATSSKSHRLCPERLPQCPQAGCACAKLRDTRLPVAAIAENLGYAHASSFIRMLKKVYGITPTQFRVEAQAQASSQLSNSEE